MTAQESKILRIQLYHPFMGIHNFDISSRQNFTDLRNMLCQHTQMTIFENFRFQANGKLLPEFQEIGQVIHNQTRINLVLQPFDERSSFYHLERVKDVLANPIQWVMLNSRQAYEQKQLPIQKLPQNITIDNFLDLQLSSTLYQSQTIPDKNITFFQHLNFSIHNPPPIHRKLAGDFYYLQIKTLEGYQEHITACPAGFFVNNSSNSCFNTTNSSGIFFYNLFDLFKYLSPRFKDVFSNLKKNFKVGQLDRAIYSSFKSPPMCDWLKNNPENNNQKKAKYNQWRYLKFDVPNDNTTIKDWNQILQLNSALSTDSQAEISNKQKNQYKLYQQFVAFAKEAAVKAVESQINAKNGSVPMINRNFTYGSVQVWFAQDDPMSYKLLQKQKPTRRAVNAQLRNLEMLENHSGAKVSLKHTVLINYKGHNVVVETIIPGAQQNPQKDYNMHKGQKIAEQLAKSLKIQSKNLYKNQNNQVDRAFIHPKLKVVAENDKRAYLVNLYTFSARDLNFPGSDNNATYLRRQLIPIFNQRQNCHRNINTMIESGYNLISNQKVGEQDMKLQSLKTFAEEIMVPLCIQSFLRGNKKYLADSKSVVKIMHKFGLGSRYLGSIYKKSSNYDAAHIKTIIQRVVLVKCLKNIFRQALRRTELGDYKNTICKLLNFIFCSQSSTNTDEYICKQDFKDEISTNASRKKKKKIDYVVEGQDDQIVLKTLYGSGVIRPVELWEQIKEVALYRYGLKFTEAKIYMIKCLENQFGKCALLRDLCLNVGIILQKTQYFQKQGIIFKPQNIEQLKPIIKHINLKNKYLQNLIQQADILIERKRVQQAIDAYNQAINYSTSNFGIMTEDLALLNKKISEIYFRIGEVDTAVIFIHCGQKMCEKIFGESHVETLQCYNLLSQYNFFMRNFETAEYYLIKTIHMSTVSYGEQYPQLIISYLNLSSLYEAWSRFMDSITCISHALRIVLRVFSEKHLTTAICYAAMSTAHFQIPDIEKSIFFQQKSIQIMKDILKHDDVRLKQAQKVLEYYNHLQSSKKVKESYEKERKKLISNPQLYAGFPLFRMPQYPKDRQFLYKKMQNLVQFPGKFFI